MLMKSGSISWGDLLVDLLVFESFELLFVAGEL